MNNPTRSEMLDAINMKIARTWWGTWPWETGYYLPITFKEVLEHFPKYEDEIALNWWDFWDPLDKQFDETVSYIYNLLSHE